MSRSPLSPTLFPVGARELPQSGFMRFLGEPLTHPFPLPFFPAYARFACVAVGKMRLPHPELRSPSPPRQNALQDVLRGECVRNLGVAPKIWIFGVAWGREPAILSERDKSRQLSISRF